jgi:ParB/RepB/Spo0J family partition protein
MGKKSDELDALIQAKKPGLSGRPLAPAATDIAGPGSQQAPPLMKPDRAAGLIPTDDVIPDTDQPRKRSGFDEDGLRLLGESLKEAQHHGIVVYWDGQKTKYVIVSGERRWRAAKLVSILELRCTLLPDKPPEADLRASQLTENAQREDLDIIEFGDTCRLVMRLRGWTAAELAKNLHLERSRVCRALAIEEYTTTELKQAVKENVVTQGDAYKSTQIGDPELRQEVQRGLIDGTKTDEDVRAAVARKPRTTRGPKAGTRKRKGSSRKPTPKAPYTESVVIPSGWRVTVVCDGAAESPDGEALAAACSAAAEMFRRCQATAA